MPSFTITQPTSLHPAEIHKRLDTLRERLSSKYGIDAQWKTPTVAEFERTGASGTIVCYPDKVEVNVDLSFLLSAMKDQIEGRIRNELQQALAVTA